MNTNTKKLTVSAVLLAIATVLSMLKLFELPFGGSVTVASMVPIVLIAYLFGTKWGIFSAFVYSLLQLILGVATGIVSRMFLPGEEQMALWQALLICLLDYVLAYLLLGMGGVFRNRFKHRGTEIVLGAVLGTVLSWAAHTLSGYLFYGAWAEWFFGDVTGLSQISALAGFSRWVMEHVTGGLLALLYSAVYNAAYMLPETIITAVISPLLYKVVEKTNIIETS